MMGERKIVRNIPDIISRIKKRDDKELLSDNGFGKEKDVMESTEFYVTTEFRE